MKEPSPAELDAIESAISYAQSLSDLSAIESMKKELSSFLCEFKLPPALKKRINDALAVLENRLKETERTADLFGNDEPPPDDGDDVDLHQDRRPSFTPF